MVGKDNILLGIIVISDTIKENAKEAIQSLKSQGIEVIILIGDNERTTKAVTSKLKYWSNCWGISPSKEIIISRLKTQEGKVVAMVGDCINDAPELVKANLGIAIGSGTDVAKVTGGIILIKDDLRDVVMFINLKLMFLKK